MSERVLRVIVPIAVGLCFLSAALYAYAAVLIVMAR